MRWLTEEQFLVFREMLENKEPNLKIVNAINISYSLLLRCKIFCRLHGIDEFYQHAVLDIRRKFTDYEYACIVERLLADEMSVDYGALLYKATRKVLYRLVKERKRSGAPLLGAVPAPLPELHSLESAKDGKEELLVGDEVMVRSFDAPTAQKVCQEEAVEAKFGRAKARVPLGRARKVMRSRALEEAKKEQKRLKEWAAGKGETSSPEEHGGDDASPPGPTLEEQVLGPFPKGKPASEYVPGVRGRRFDIDIHSEGFEDLPIEVRTKALENYTRKLEIRLEALKKLSALVQEEH